MDSKGPNIHFITIPVLEFSALVEAGYPRKVLDDFLLKTLFPDYTLEEWMKENPEMVESYNHRK